MEVACLLERDHVVREGGEEGDAEGRRAERERRVAVGADPVDVKLLLRVKDERERDVHEEEDGELVAERLGERVLGHRRPRIVHHQRGLLAHVHHREGDEADAVEQRARRAEGEADRDVLDDVRILVGELELRRGVRLVETVLRVLGEAPPRDREHREDEDLDHL